VNPADPVIRAFVAKHRTRLLAAMGGEAADELLSDLAHDLLARVGHAPAGGELRQERAARTEVRRAGGGGGAAATAVAELERFRVRVDALSSHLSVVQHEVADLRGVLHHLADGVVLADGEGNLLHWNAAALRLHGYRDEADVQRHLATFRTTFELRTLDGQLLDFESWPMHRLLRGEPVTALELRVRRTDIGAEWIVRYDGTAFEDSVTGATRAVLFLHDLTAERMATRRQRASEELYHGLVDLLPVAVYLLRGERIALCNPALAQLLGAPGSAAVVGKSVFDLFADDDHGLIRARIASVQVDPRPMGVRECRLRRVDGRLVPVAMLARPIVEGDNAAILVVLSDLTERDQARRVEQQFLQAQKMEAVGRLAAGVAHDFNNLLTVVLGSCDLLQSQPGSVAEDSRRWLAAVRDAGERAARLTRQLLAFTRRVVVDPRNLDLGTLVAETGQMLKRLLGADVELRIERVGRPAVVRADASQLEQLLLNMAVNARDAMPDGGVLTITTRGDTPGDHMVELTVADTGTGMEADVRARLFEPFFTTKPMGKGTGLGLAVVQSVVEQSHGTIEVDSEPGRGTRFRFRFPAVAPSDEPESAEPSPPPVAKGAESIVLVEDDVQVRKLTRAVLERAGYAVQEFRDADEALRAAYEPGWRADLLLTDVVLPGAGSAQLVPALRGRLPGLPVVCMSGYADDEMLRRGLGGNAVSFLAKPFPPQDLLAVVRAALDARRAASG
jgi:two-component system cell cycle sensor histidine kinase/response regulator CckA